MKKTILWFLTALVALAALGYGYLQLASPTKIAFVNYMDFMYNDIVEANENSFIKTDQILFDAEAFKNATDYDVIFLFAHGKARLSKEQEAQIAEAREHGVRIISGAMMGDSEIPGLTPQDIKYINECMSNGGTKNTRRLLNYCRKILDGKSLFVDKVTEPFIYPRSYYYHLGDEEVFTTAESYIDFLKKTGRYHPDGKNICLTSTMFGASGEDGVIDQLVTGLEGKGYNVFPITAFGPELVHLIKQANPNLIIYNAHGNLSGSKGVEFLKQENVPMLCPLVVFSPAEEWMNSRQGLDGGMLSQSVTMPETDGGVVPFALGAQFKNERGLYVFRGIKKRINTFLQLTDKWMALQKLPNSEKKLAIFYYKEAGKNAMVAEGMEIAPSLLNLLKSLQKAGYQTGSLPETDKELSEVIQEKGPVFGDYAKGSFEEYVKTGNPLLLSGDDVRSLLEKGVEPELQKEMVDSYGEAPGKLMVAQQADGPKLVIPRVQFGNVVLLPVPPAGVGDDQVALVHGAGVAPPYPYVSAYLWAKEGFNANAIVHFGTHGSVEFTPGKQIALSQMDWPDALLAGTPHFYIYVISNIGEAMIAKRRTYAVMNTHLTPPLMESDVYGPLKKIDDLMEKFGTTENSAMKEQYRISIKELMLEADLDKDLNYTFTEDQLPTDLQLERLHHYLSEVEVEKVTKGLHVLGQPYTDDEVATTVKLMAIDSLIYSKMDMDQAQGKVTLKELEDIHFVEQTYRVPTNEIIHSVLYEGADPLQFLPKVEPQADSKKLSPKEKAYQHALEDYKQTLVSLNRYKKALEDSPHMELQSFLNALNGGYMAPQSGGDPAFNPEAVPTGRNLYSINEMKTPSKEAFEVGKNQINQILKKHFEEKGTYPKKVAFTLWGSEFIRQEGVTLAQIFYLLGVEPVMDRRGTVYDVKLIPMEELKRPRIDVVVQTSGQFRDLAASRIYLINRAVQLAAQAKDQDSKWENFVAEGVTDSEAMMKSKGVSPAEARKLSTLRVFGGINGGYSTGIMGLVENGDHWDNEDQISEQYLHNMSALYGKDNWGVYKEGAFEGALQNAQMLIHPRSANTWGPLSLDHVYEFMGGLSSAIRYVTGEEPEAWFSDLRSPKNPKVQTLEDAIWVEARSSVLNPKYIKGMQEEGATGAETFAEIFRNSYGWESMRSSAIDEAYWDQINDVYIDDKYDLGIGDYFREKNPYAYEEMTAVMLEVVRKGYWKPDEAVIRKIVKLHAKLVKDFEAGCSGFVCNNEKLHQMMLKYVNASEAQDLNDALEAVHTGKANEDVQGMQLKEQKTKEDKQETPQKKAVEEQEASHWVLWLLVLFILVLIAQTLYRARKSRRS